MDESDKEEMNNMNNMNDMKEMNYIEITIGCIITITIGVGKRRVL